MRENRDHFEAVKQYDFGTDEILQGFGNLKEKPKRNQLEQQARLDGKMMPTDDDEVSNTADE